MADWLTTESVTHVAMESTGVYWKPIYDLLEGRVILLGTNAKHVKHVPGRKTMSGIASGWRSCSSADFSRVALYRTGPSGSYETSPAIERSIRNDIPDQNLLDNLYSLS